jgi:hypothetical protein
VEREEFAGFYAASFQRLVGQRAGTVKARLARGRAGLAPYLQETAAPVTE